MTHSGNASNAKPKTALISSEAFARKMQLLAERFNRDLSLEIVQGYHKIIAAELTTGEFADAVETIFRYSRFFPSPQEIIEAVRGSPETRAEAEWIELVSSQQDNRPPQITRLGRRALDSVGGAWALSRESTVYLRREFLRAYLALCVSERQLESILEEGQADTAEVEATAKARLKALVGLGHKEAE